MFLHELPAELLRIIVRRLSPHERLPLRKTCRMFCSLVENEGLLPFNPVRIYIDFWRQIIAVFMREDETNDYISLANGNVRRGEPLLCQSRCPEEFARVVYDIETMRSIHHRFLDVGDNWTKYVNDYLRRMNKHFNPGNYSRIVVILGEEVPPQLLHLSIRVDVVDIQAEHPIWTDRYLPDSLVSWIGKVSNGRDSYITVCFAPMSPNQLDIMARIPSMFVDGFLDDDGAMHLLEMFENRTFPNMDCWLFKLPRDPTRFLSALVSSRRRRAKSDTDQEAHLQLCEHLQLDRGHLTSADINTNQGKLELLCIHPDHVCVRVLGGLIKSGHGNRKLTMQKFLYFRGLKAA